ncbi:MAG: phytoene/squalene synthase family protein [Pseudomonadota bacterium]
MLQTTGAVGRQLDEDDLLKFCEQRIEKGSKSFAGAAKLFDAPTRRSAIMLYAWCRYCDDVVDGQELGFTAPGGPDMACSKRLDELRRTTQDALEGRFDQPAFQALASVAARHNIAARHPLDLIEGFAMDVDGRAYETMDETLSYCYHVAGVVGVMMAFIMGVDEDDVEAQETLARASDLGIAFQLTNIARDVIPDAQSGRVYLPRDLLFRHGFNSADAQCTETLASPEMRPKIAAAVNELLSVADDYYHSAGLGIGRLPFRSAWAIASARRVYRDIGRLVRSRGETAWDARVSTSRAAKLAGSGVALGEAIAARSARAKSGDLANRSGLWTPPFLRV